MKLYPLAIFTECSISDVWMGSKYASAVGEQCFFFVVTGVLGVIKLLVNQWPKIIVNVT